MPLKSTLTEFIIGEQRKYSHATGGFTALLNDIQLACKRIAQLLGNSPNTSGTWAMMRPICSGSMLSITKPRYLP